jgi:phage protein D
MEIAGRSFTLGGIILPEEKMAKARKRVANARIAKRKPSTKAKTRKASVRKSKARKTKTRKSAAKRPARKRRPKQGIADKLASGVQVLADSFEESAKMRRKMGTRTGIGEG